jgi:type IV fimbrial biogenesis protein FimT
VVHRSLSRLAQHGFSAIELVVVIAIVGIVAAISIPTLFTYFQASTLKAGSDEVVAALNQARQLAITQNRSVCVEVTGNRYRYRLSSCTGTIWTGPATDANGFFPLSNNLQLVPTPAGVYPVFNYLGAATTPATLTVTYVNQSGTPGEALDVVVAASGRIRVQ